MKLLSYIYILLFSFSLFAQDNVDQSWTESQVTLEEKYMDANTHIIVGKYDEALKLLKEIYKEDNSNPGLNFEIAKVYGSLNDLPSAIKHAKKAVEYSPNNEFYHLVLGNLLLESNQTSEAISSLNKLILLKPEKTEYYDMLAKAHLRANEYQNALNTFSKLESQIGFSEDLALRQIDILNEYGKSNKVIEILEKLISADPKEIRHRYNLASYYQQNGDKKKATEVYQEIIKIDPEDAVANLALLDSIDNPSNETGYLSALQPLIEDENIPLDKKILEMIPYLERVTSEPQLGEPLLRIGKTLVQLYPNDAKVHALYADIFNGLGKTDKAIDQYEKTLALDDRVYSVWEQLILAYDANENYSAMIKKAEEAIDLFPNNASAYYLYASGQISSGNLVEVESYLDDASMIAGKDLYHKARVENQRARLAMINKEYDKAAKHLSLSSEWSMGQDAESVELLGDLSLLQGNKSEALKYWKEAKRLGNTSTQLEEKIANGAIK